MFDFAAAPVNVREDIRDAFRRLWAGLASPGASLTGSQRVAIARVARDSEQRTADVPEALQDLATMLMVDPAKVGEAEVRRAADGVGEAPTVEIIAIVSMLSAADTFHDALGLDREPLPTPIAGEPTGDIRADLKRRRTYVPMPPGPIPFALDLVPSDAELYLSLHGPLYMTDEEMSSDDFAREPGLNRAQMELISARLSFHNKCFY